MIQYGGISRVKVSSDSGENESARVDRLQVSPRHLKNNFRVATASNCDDARASLYATH